MAAWALKLFMKAAGYLEEGFDSLINLTCTEEAQIEAGVSRS